MSRIGRNAPCPCGSGRKHKSCCLPLLEAGEREDRTLEATFGRMLDWVAEEHRAVYEEAGDLTRFERLLCGPLLRQLYSLWAIIDYTPSDGGPSLAARYAARAGLAPAEQESAARIAATRLGVHRVLDVLPGAWVDLEPLAGGESVRAISPLASTRTQTGKVMLTRLVPGPPAPSIWGAGALFDAGSVRKWTSQIRTLPADRAEAALALLRFHPDDHAEPLSSAHLRVSATWPVHDDELVLETLEEAPLFESLGQEIGGGWAFAWLRPDGDLRAAPMPDDDLGERIESARVVVDGDLLTVHAASHSVSGDLAAYLERELDGLIAPADNRRAA